MQNILFENPTVLCNHTTPAMRPGTILNYWHATYGWWTVVYTQTVDAVTYAAGQVLTKAHLSWSKVTNDISGGTSIGKVFGGIALGVYTEGEYNYVLIGGHYPTVKTNGDDDIADGVQLIVGAADGVCDSGTALQSFGCAVGADVDAANTVAADIKGNF